MKTFVGFIFLFLSFFSSASEILSWKTLEESIEKNKFKSIESLLEYWAEKDPNFFQDYTLVYKSISLQRSSYEYPRALVFNEKSDLVLTFNGNPEDKGFESIELLRWNKTTFEFRNIYFQDERLHVSDANPSRCMTCHTDQARPLWDPYENWLGVFGSHDDAIIDFVNDKYAPAGYSDESKEIIQKEFYAITEFNQKRTDHPRYRFLNPIHKTPMAPYENRIKGELKNRPNLKLTKFFSKRNAYVLLEKVKNNNTCFNEIKNIFYGSLLKCELLSNQSAEWKSLLDEINKTLIEKGEWDTRRPWDMLNEKNDLNSPKGIYLLLGLRAQDFNLSRLAKDWSYFQGEEHTRDQLARLVYLGSPESYSLSEDPRFQSPLTSQNIDMNLIFGYLFYNNNFYKSREEIEKNTSLALEQLNSACKYFLEKQTKKNIHELYGACRN